MKKLCIISLISIVIAMVTACGNDSNDTVATIQGESIRESKSGNQPETKTDEKNAESSQAPETEKPKESSSVGNIPASENEGEDKDSVDSDNTVAGREIRYIDEQIDIANLKDGTYPVKVAFDHMTRNEKSLSLGFRIFTVVHYAPEEINHLIPGDIIYEYVDETTVNSHVVDTANFPIDEVCVVNGGSERGEGITFSKDDSGLYRISLNEGYTRLTSHGIVTMEISDDVSFEDNFNLDNKNRKATELYDYLKGLDDFGKSCFNENNTFIKISGGKIVSFYRIYLP